MPSPCDPAAATAGGQERAARGSRWSLISLRESSQTEVRVKKVMIEAPTTLLDSPRTGG